MTWTKRPGGLRGALAAGGVARVFGFEATSGTVRGHFTHETCCSHPDEIKTARMAVKDVSPTAAKAGGPGGLAHSNRIKTANPVGVKSGHLGHLADQFLTSKGANPIPQKVGTLGTLPENKGFSRSWNGDIDLKTSSIGPGPVAVRLKPVQSRRARSRSRPNRRAASRPAAPGP